MYNKVNNSILQFPFKILNIFQQFKWQLYISITLSFHSILNNGIAHTYVSHNLYLLVCCWFFFSCIMQQRGCNVILHNSLWTSLCLTKKTKQKKKFCAWEKSTSTLTKFIFHFCYMSCKYTHTVVPHCSELKETYICAYKLLMDI